MKLIENKDKAIELKQIIEQSPVTVFLLKNQEGWPVEFVSGNVKQLLDYSAEDFLNGTINYSDLVHKDDIHRVTNEIKQFRDRGNTFKHEPYRIVNRKGKIIWVDNNTSVRRNEKGDITHYQGVIIDISEKMKNREQLIKLPEVEKILVESKEIQEIVLNSLDEALYLSSAENNILYLNNAMTKKIGYDAIGQKCYHAIYNRNVVCEDCYFETLKEKGTVHVEKEKDGRKYKISSTLLKNDSKLTVYYDITDRKENEKLKKAKKKLIKAKRALRKNYVELEMAKEKAEESDRLKTLFINNMSHEIRTPMNGIIGFSNLLVDPELTKHQKNKYIEIIQTNGQHLLNIITDIMDISKIEAGQFKTKEIKTNINDMLKDLFSLYRLPAQKKNIRLIINNH